MNWHETIAQIRKDPKYAELVEQAYFDADLQLNVERFGKSAEFIKTLEILQKYSPDAKTILDIGSGNGISAVNFALRGYTVTAVEPDPSDSVGANAIRKLQAQLELTDMNVFEQFAENIGFADNSFDVVYVRQAVHHAYNLTEFLAECGRVLKPGGILLTIRDHVVFDAADKQWFLEMHPLHRFYGGENAFSPAEYRQAMQAAGLQIERELKFYDSVINYFPTSEAEIAQRQAGQELHLAKELQRKLGLLGRIPLLQRWYKAKNSVDGSLLNERAVPGRMYSYICIKP
ncbi:class I SAM-dependent methyltransferase [Hymenobacter metallilatus]|uniref:Methyltransferase domain-containing protein n=1 Tax=Hymenobacter metallilatus TaxID=2493666 RepID=A0A3R9M3U8_9BACT|nr:class I SAM-dependent methyltransferase [Hymenobacter metallilatus]RSK36040.1 methyltransferase domain-containing protein [Hymenobacter metallilatus]